MGFDCSLSMEYVFILNVFHFVKCLSRDGADKTKLFNYNELGQLLPAHHYSNIITIRAVPLKETGMRKLDSFNYGTGSAYVKSWGRASWLQLIFNLKCGKAKTHVSKALMLF